MSAESDRSSEGQADVPASQNNLPIEETGHLERIQRQLQKDTTIAMGTSDVELPGTSLVFHPSITDREAALRSLARIHLPGIKETLVKMTGYTPVNMPQSTMLHAAPLNSTQAAILAKAYTPLSHDPRSKRLHFRFKGLTTIDAIDGNVRFLEADPEEAKGVYFHELGHVWTSNIYALDDGRSDTYVEGFGELFRSAAALYEGADWTQATGCRGMDLLSGTELPNVVIPHWQNMRIPIPLANAGRFGVCNRIIEHLGGLTERTLHGLSKACDVGALPSQGNSFSDVLQAIERETGVREFARNVLHDPALTFGGMKPGPVVIGMPAANNNGYRIDCFMITDPDATWGLSRQTYDVVPKTIGVNSSTFDFRGVRIEPIPFHLTFHNEEQDVSMSVTVDSGEIVLCPEQILDLALMGNTGWPAGKTTVRFSVFHQPPQDIRTPIVLSEEVRRAYQRKKGVKFAR